MASERRLAKAMAVPFTIALAAALGTALLIMLWTCQGQIRTTRSTHFAVTAVAPKLTSQSTQHPLHAPRHTGLSKIDSTAPWPLDLHYTEWQFRGVQKPRVVEGDIELVPICNASFVSQHPLASADYMRSYRPGSPCSMPQGLLQKMSSGQPVHITVVGGSMTQGRRCLDGVRWMRDCSWSSRLQDRLRESFPTGNITVHNKAIPGFSYNHWLQSGMLDGLVQTDVLVIDEQVNSHQYSFDAYRQMEAVDEFLHGMQAAARRQQRQIGLLFVEVFRSCFKDQETCDKSCGKMDQGRQGLFNTTLEGHTAEYRYCSRWWSTPDIERPVVRHYQIPTASYRDAVWPNLNQPRNDLPCLWNGRSHPEAISHYIIGDVVAYGFIAALVDSSIAATNSGAECAEWRSPTKFHPHMESLDYCTPPTNGTAAVGTFMSAFEPASFQPLASGSWAWREDVPGKPGWIHDPNNTTASAAETLAAPAPAPLPMPSPTNSVDNTTIWFKVAFSSNAQLQVTYLTSYTNIGAAELTIHSMAAAEKLDNSTALAGYVLNAKINDAVSIPKTVVFVQPARAHNARIKSVTLVLPGSVGAGNYIVSLRAVPPQAGESHKFKLLGIASC